MEDFSAQGFAVEISGRRRHGKGTDEEKIKCVHFEYVRLRMSLVEYDFSS